MFRVLWGIILTLTLLGIGCKKGGTTGSRQMPAPQVIVAEARTERVVETLSLIANVQANEMIDIKAEADGVVQEILFEEGQPVEKGQLLVRLDETRFAASLAQAEANYQLSESIFQRSKQLFEGQLISQQEFDQAASTFQANTANVDWARRQLKDARIYAPFAGVMSSRNISPGQVISKNTIVSWLIDLDPVKIEFQIPERFIGQVKTGQQIEMSVAAYPNREFSGEVFFISPYVDPTNRTALVKAYIPNPKLELKPGMFANLDLTLTVRENSLVIPELALAQILTNNQAVVYAVDSNNVAHPRTIKTGLRLVGTIEVLEGLKAGDRVIIEGLQKVIPGSPVRVASPEGSNPAASPVGEKAS